jgi:hypothetical protein
VAAAVMGLLVVANVDGLDLFEESYLVFMAAERGGCLHPAVPHRKLNNTTTIIHQIEEF